MNDPYKSKRLALCKQQTMLHNANCTRCEKIMGLPVLSDRSNICHKCDIGAELRSIGKDFSKCVRHRKKLPIVILDKKEDEELCGPKIEQYLKFRADGLSHTLIAEKWGVHFDTVRKFAKKNNLVTKSAKHGPKNEILDKLTVDEYFELKKKWRKDTKIAEVLACDHSTIVHFKRKNGLMKKIKAKGAV